MAIEKSQDHGREDRPPADPEDHYRQTEDQGRGIDEGKYRSQHECQHREGQEPVLWCQMHSNLPFCGMEWFSGADTVKGSGKEVPDDYGEGLDAAEHVIVGGELALAVRDTAYRRDEHHH